MKTMKLLGHILLAAIVAACVFFLLDRFHKPQEETASAAQSAYDRVMASGTLRCGYIVFPPQFDKDPNSGTFTGIAHDITEEMAKRLNLKVEWVEESNFASMNESLNNGRFDALCFSLYRWVPSARAVDYSVPLFCSPTYVYVRADDARFDGGLNPIDDPNVKIGNIDGEGSDAIAREDFPKASVVSFPQNTDLGQLFLNLETGKIDIVIANPLMASRYLQNNPGKVKNVTLGKPIRTYCHSLAFKKGEAALINTVNLALEEMLNFGTIDRILRRYEPSEGVFFRISPPYEVSKGQTK